MPLSILDFIKSNWLDKLVPGDGGQDRYGKAAIQSVFKYLKETIDLPHNDFVRMVEDTRLEMPYPHGPREFQGKPIKRVKKWLAAVNQTKLNKDQESGLDVVGEQMEKARNAGLAPGRYFSVFKRIWWPSPNMGQEGRCCYYKTPHGGGLPHYRDMFAAAENVFAFTLWEKAGEEKFREDVMPDVKDWVLPEEFTGYRGVARCWLAFDRKNPNALFVTNDYGEGLKCGTVAQHLADRFGLLAANGGSLYGIGTQATRTFTLHLHNVWAVAKTHEIMKEIDPEVVEDNWDRTAGQWKKRKAL